MPPAFKRQRQSSTTSVTSRTSRASSSRRITPAASFKHPFRASRPQRQRKQDTVASQPLQERVVPILRVPLSQNDELSPVFDDDDIDETLENVVMAIDIKERGTVGCAYYIAREERLFCMEDIVNGGNDVTETCNYHSSHLIRLLTILVKLEIQPTVVLLSLRIDSEEAELDAMRDVRQASLVDEGSISISGQCTANSSCSR